MSRILVIDDDAQVRLTLTTVLSRWGHDVICAQDGKEGLRLFTEIAPDLVITDIIMPEQEGIATITQAKTVAPGTRIIAISGGGRIGNADMLRLASIAGADDILAKPFSLGDLMDVLKRNLASAA